MAEYLAPNFLRLAFTSKGVGVIRELLTLWKSKIGVVSSTESESEESECFHFFRSVARHPVKTWLSESEAEAEEPTNRKARNRSLSLVYSSASACDSDNAVHLIISDGNISRISHLLPTQSVWFSLDRITLRFWIRLGLVKTSL